MNNLRIVAYCKAHERDDGSWAGGDTELGTIEDVDIIPPIGSDISTKWGLQTVRRQRFDYWKSGDGCTVTLIVGDDPGH